MNQKKLYLTPWSETVSLETGSVICVSGQENESFSVNGTSYGNDDFDE